MTISRRQQEARRENGKSGGRPSESRTTSLSVPITPEGRLTQMHRLWVQGWTFQQLGARFDVTRQAVQKMLARHYGVYSYAVCYKCESKRDVRYMRAKGDKWACSPRCPE